MGYLELIQQYSFKYVIWSFFISKLLSKVDIIDPWGTCQGCSRRVWVKGAKAGTGPALLNWANESSKWLRV